MMLVAVVLSLFVAALGALGVASPSRLIAVLRYFQTSRGLYFTAALRVIFGVALFFVAPTSRAPELISVLGVIIIVVGVITPVFGFERFRKFLDWWFAQGATVIRAWAVLALVFGLFLTYAVVPWFRAV